jgi:putative restriction endonuclease
MARRNWQHAAGVLWPVIAKSAKARETLTYGQLAPLIGTIPLSVRYALGPIQDFCLEMRLPPLTAIVIGKNSKEPGSGFIAWDVDDLPTAQALVFDKDWRKVPNPYVDFGSTDTETSFADQILKNPEVAADIYACVKVRGIVQRIFRIALLEADGHRCAFCGLSFDGVLEAAHIKAWGKSSLGERLDPRNGILLCASHHRLFDQACFTITKQKKIFYYDSEGKDGPYGAADKSASLDLHGKSLLLPRDERLWPSVDFISERNEDPGWESLL